MGEVQGRDSERAALAVQVAVDGVGGAGEELEVRFGILRPQLWYGAPARLAPVSETHQRQAKSGCATLCHSEL